MEIKIGREPVNSRLLITEGNRTAYIGDNGSVPNSVSRNTNDKCHCVLIVDNNGNMKIKNGKSENLTFVNGTQVEEKAVNESSTIQLSNAKYTVSVSDILKALKNAATANVGTGGNTPQKPAPQPNPTNEVSIKHLEEVYKQHAHILKQINNKYAYYGIVQSVSGILTPVSMVCVFIPGLEKLRFNIIIITVVLSIIFFIFRALTVGKQAKELEAENNRFFQTYVCPNNDCKHFVGNKPYMLLRQDPGCPYCKAKYKE